MPDLAALPPAPPVAMPIPAGPRPARGPSGRRGAEPVCGWFDSSTDLTRGLDVSEQDGDALYRLWQLSPC